MTTLYVFVVAALILLHAPDGHEIAVNRDQITNLQVGDPKHKHGVYPSNARCLINFVDGRFVAVIEECHNIIQMMEDRK